MLCIPRSRADLLIFLSLALLGVISIVTSSRHARRQQSTPTVHATNNSSVITNSASSAERRASAPLTLTEPDNAKRAQVNKAYGSLPLRFEANVGQSDSRVQFLSRGRGYTLFLTAAEAVLALSKAKSAIGRQRGISRRVGRPTPTEEHRDAVVRMQLVGANSEPQVKGKHQLSSKINYYIGNEPLKWRTGVPIYAKVEYIGIYPGIDLVYYGNQRQLEYDFVVSPGASPKDIHLSFKGARKIQVNANGELVLRTAAGEVNLHKPLVYQEIDGKKRELAGRYVFEGESGVGFDVEPYDACSRLVIDP